MSMTMSIILRLIHLFFILQNDLNLHVLSIVCPVFPTVAYRFLRLYLEQLLNDTSNLYGLRCSLNIHWRLLPGKSIATRMLLVCSFCWFACNPALFPPRPRVAAEKYATLGLPRKSSHPLTSLHSSSFVPLFLRFQWVLFPTVLQLL